MNLKMTKLPFAHTKEYYISNERCRSILVKNGYISTHDTEEKWNFSHSNYNMQHFYEA